MLNSRLLFLKNDKPHHWITTKLQAVGIGNFRDTLYACKRVPTRFKKPCSPVFLNNYEQSKTTNFLHTFADIAEETTCENSEKKNSTWVATPRSFHWFKEPTRFLEVFIKSYIYIYNFSFQNKYNHMTKKFAL